MPQNDFIESLLNMVGNLGRSISSVGTALGPGLDIAKAVYGGFNTLLGLNEVRQVVASLNGTMLTQSGYYLLSSTPPGSIDLNGLEVRNGMLYRGQNPVTNVDYCIVALPLYESVLDAAKMAPQLFDEQWTEVNDAIGEADPKSGEGAEAILRKIRALLAAISTSPDLIQADRTTLMATYTALYNDQVRLHHLPDSALLTRGPGDGGMAEAVSAQALTLRADGRAAAASALETIAAALDDENLVPPASRDTAKDLAERKAGEQNRVRAVAKALQARLGKSGADESVADALLKSTFYSRAA